MTPACEIPAGLLQADRSEPEPAPGHITWVDASAFTVSAADINDHCRQMMAEPSIAHQVEMQRATQELQRAMEQEVYAVTGIGQQFVGGGDTRWGAVYLGGDGRVRTAMQWTQEQIEEYQRQIAEQYKRSEDAAKRGMALLKSWLSPEQLEQYERNQYFDVIGSKGTRYRITNGVAGNVHELDGRGKQVASYCFQPQGGLCMGDTMLAQKIALETDEKAAIKVANKMQNSCFLAVGTLTEAPQPLRRGSRFLGWLTGD